MSEEMLLHVLSLRLQHSKPLASHAFFEDPNVLACFDPTDVEELLKTEKWEQKKHRYIEKLHTRVKKYNEKKTKKYKGKALATLRKSYPVNDSVEEARKYVPPGQFKWKLYKDMRNNRWQCYNSIAYVSKSWPLRQPRDALREILKEVWDKAVELKEVDECPYEFLTKADWTWP